MTLSNMDTKESGIYIRSRETVLPGLQALLSKGFSVQARVGGSLSRLLCGQLGIDADYLKNRVQTLFLNSSPVDDVEKTVVSDGDIVALSAAMPGLVGATMRKGGFYAKLRQRISCQATGTGSGDSPAESTLGTVTIRLFNVVARELGPAFLEKGVDVDVSAVRVFLNLAAPVLTGSESSLMLDGKKVTLAALLEAGRPGQAIRLSIQATGDGR